MISRLIVDQAKAEARATLGDLKLARLLLAAGNRQGVAALDRAIKRLEDGLRVADRLG